MFSHVIGKQCRDPQCRLTGQLQGAELVACAGCGGALVPEIVEDKRTQAFFTAATALVWLVIVLAGYGWVAKRLGPLSTVEWLLGRIQINDSFRPREAQDWIAGDAVFFNQTGQIPHGRDGFLYRVKNGRRTSTFRERLKSGTRMKFDVTPVVPLFYMLYEGGDDSRLLFPFPDSPSAEVQGAVSIPDDSHLIEMSGGPMTEQFVLIAARKPLPAVEALRTKPRLVFGDIDAAVRTFEKDPDAYILHVEIPHE
jgi:hypothetical protein